MGVQRIVKLPFRAVRAGFRLVRGVVAPADAATPSPVAQDVRAAEAPVVTPVVAPVVAEVAPPVPAAPVQPRIPVSIRVEETPNPDARKFVCSRKLVEKGSLVFNDAAAAADVPFALAVFELGGVRTVFATRDFVTVTRMSDAPSWREMQPRIEAALRESLSR